jgi:diguanylate cyclase (GGDEF)-like protein
VALLAEVERLRGELAAAQAENRRLAALVDEDPLCRILNRRGFERAFGSAVAHVARYGDSAALLLLDLDGFKAVNDTRGHPAGDALLREVATVLSAHLRASDVVARIGGDEFAVILWRVDESTARAKAARLKAILPCSSSIGVARLEGTDGAAILARADADLYDDKRRRALTR